MHFFLLIIKKEANHLLFLLLTCILKKGGSEVADIAGNTESGSKKTGSRYFTRCEFEKYQACFMCDGDAPHLA